MTIARWIFAGAVIVLVTLIAISSLQPREAPPVSVHTATASRTSITRTVSGAGKLEPERKINVSSNITGVLLRLDVEIGSVVKKNQVIGQIDTSRYKAQFQQQQAQLRSAQADTQRARANVAYLVSEEKRAKQLVESKVAGASELDRARSSRALAAAELKAAEGRAKMASAALSEARSALGWATLTAPAAGTVLSINHRPGERVRGSDFAEDVIVTLGSIGEVYVKLEVGEQDVVFIQPGQSATVEIDAFGDQTFTGKVIDAGRDAIVKNQGTENEVTTFPVWVALDKAPPRALSGMSAQVNISTETRKDVVAVPIQAVTVRPPDMKPGEAPAGKNKLDKVVFVMAGGVVKKRVVQVGLSSDSHVEITRGLQPGEVVIEGPYRTLARELQDGGHVTVEQPMGMGAGPEGKR
jgi:HlyD family secretion protein